MERQQNAPTTVRLTPEITAEVRALAERLGLSFNGALRMLLVEALEARGTAPHRRDRGTT